MHMRLTPAVRSPIVLPIKVVSQTLIFRFQSTSSHFSAVPPKA